MALFFFHHHDAGDVTYDDVGCEFDTLELAYLEAFRSALAIGAESVLEQIDPSLQRIEIVDHNQVHLTEIRFDEIFRRRDVPPPRFGSHRSELRAQVERTRQLRAEMRKVCADARETIAAARLTMVRATRTA